VRPQIRPRALRSSHRATGIRATAAGHNAQGHCEPTAATAAGYRRACRAINQIIAAELSVGFESKAAFHRALQSIGLIRLNLPWAAAWLAWRAFLAYRRQGGARTVPLPDFFIGAHAEAADLALLTRDPARIRTHFPDVEVIAPS
jgi:predicted nucleic acid-binding protein